MFFAKFKLDEDMYASQQTGLLTFRTPAEVFGRGDLDKLLLKFSDLSRKLETAEIKSDTKHTFARSSFNGAVSVYKISFTVDPLQDGFVKKLSKYLKETRPKRARKASHALAGGPPSA